EFPGYFAYAPHPGQLAGWSLPGPDALNYEPIVAQQGRRRSEGLGLDLASSKAGSSLLWRRGAARDARVPHHCLDSATRCAEEEAGRAERYATRLRELAIDPDDIQ